VIITNCLVITNCFVITTGSLTKDDLSFIVGSLGGSTSAACSCLVITTNLSLMMKNSATKLQKCVLILKIWLYRSRNICRSRKRRRIKIMLSTAKFTFLILQRANLTFFIFLLSLSRSALYLATSLTKISSKNVA
jgi:hypothetical protein